MMRQLISVHSSLLLSHADFSASLTAQLIDNRVCLEITVGCSCDSFALACGCYDVCHGSSPPSTSDIVLRNDTSARTPKRISTGRLPVAAEYRNPVPAMQNCDIFMLVLLSRHQAVFSFEFGMNPISFIPLNISVIAICRVVSEIFSIFTFSPFCPH